MWNEPVLTKKQVVVFFSVVSLIYVYPVIRADYAYIDDSWRSLLLAGDGWKNQGRILLEVLHKFLTFTGGTTNIFPLPLLISVFAMVLAMTRLTCWYFPTPSWVACLVVLPVLCNPFFLGNIAYQYDGPGMILAVAAVIYAITCTVENVFLRGLVAAVSMAVTLALYQLTITLFIGLCCIECLWGVRNRIEVNSILYTLLQRGLQLLCAGLIYYLTAYQFITSHRGDSILFDANWLSVVQRKFLFSMGSIYSLANAWNAALFVGLLVVASVGLLSWLASIATLQGRPLGKIVVLIACLGVLPVLLLCVPGAILFLAEPNLDARNYIGFSAVLVLLLLLSYDVLGRVWKPLRVLLGMV
ncbi:glucosyltransferase domain-containing protein [Pseudomonas fluorescens]|uniref:Glucosyltransferase domain-containing protein n=1 Tax=Pseudomonas fluorescens TaxID=294 RepID=A0A7M2J9U1_PSEFL|nr:glucosyltransferase domain-containing protein [Pseudomonas fluorescens]QOU06431.1 glucosyltransferase domain-containing protein [Pseudomonas fluorescens]